MKRSMPGFSILEVISTLVILAVVAAAAAATVAPLRTKANDQRAKQEIAQLNDLAHRYFQSAGKFPANVNDLVRTGLLPSDAPDLADRIRLIRRNYRYSPGTGTFSQR
jgi:prepilin-type N-terminal cleavage/methylation domain-containing protein